jgi:hypothetical protein
MNELFLDSIKRIKDIKNLHTDTEVAEVLGITKNNLYAFKNRKSLPIKHIHTFCSREGIRFEYIVDGKLPIYESETRMVSEPQTPYHATTESTPEDLGKLIKQTTDVLLSNTKYGKALKENIEAFHEAVNERKKISDPSGAAGGSKAAKKRAAQ